jgi:transcriptional regulator with XRE-family HTH domain
MLRIANILLTGSFGIRIFIIRMSPKQYSSLAEYLEAEGATQAELATLLGISQGSMSRIVNGQQLPDAETMLRIQELTGVPVEALVRTRAEAAS